MTRELKLRFDSAMFKLYKRAKRKAGYNATRYLQMLDEHRGLETARSANENGTGRSLESH